jgi:hypothetical protein
MDPTQSTGAVPTWTKFMMGVWGLFGDEVSNVAITGLAELHQNWTDRWAAKQKYFQAVTYGPHVYGLSLMILLGLFPVVALFALCPGQWRVFLNFLKVFISVKLWPIGWTLLSTFNQRRGALEAFDAPERVAGNAFLAISSMYLLIPAFSFILVQLATSAAALPFAQAVPPAAGPGSGPVSPAVSIAARVAR